MHTSNPALHPAAAAPTAATSIAPTAKLAGLGINIYHRSHGMPTGLLLDGLLPAVTGLEVEDPGVRFVYTFFDARGPHVFAALLMPTSTLASARQQLGDSLRGYLRREPLPAEVSEKEALSRHRACAGRALAAVDLDEGLPPVNTVLFFPHDARAYPFSLCPLDADLTGLWSCLHRITRSNLEAIAKSQHILVGLRWMAALDHALRGNRWTHEEHTEDLAASFWAWEARALLPGLAMRPDQRLERSDDNLRRALGPANLAAFDRSWTPSEGPLLQLAKDLVHLARPQRRIGAQRTGLTSAPSSQTEQHGFALLRELNHFVLLQLRMPVRQQIPAVLYAYLRSRDAHH